MIWHSASSDRVTRELDTNLYKGLSQEEAVRRLRRYGPNQLQDQKQRSLGQIALAQLRSKTLMIVLIAAAVWFVTGLLTQSGSGQSLWGAAAIVAVCALGVAIGVLKEWCAAYALARQRSRFGFSAVVLRDGQTLLLPAAQVVPGDVLLLRQGDYVPADARLLRADGLRCDESALTGEPVSVEKSADVILSDIAPLEERANMVFAGTAVTDGTATAVVTATGMQAERAKIASVAEDVRGAAALQTRWNDTANYLIASAGIAGVVLFVLGMVLTPGSLFDRFSGTFLTCAAAVAAAAPETVAATIAVVLAVGISRLSRHKMQVSSLSAADALGRVSVICADKTGTLTDNRMTMTCVFDGQQILPLEEDTELPQAVKDLLLMGAMCCDADVQTVNGRQRITGDHTEAGMVEAAYRYAGTDKQTVDSMYPRLCQLPFDAHRKLKTSVNMIDGKPVAVVKGAPDILFDRCNTYDAKAAAEAARAMAKGALRVIGIAYKPLAEAPANPTEEALEHDLIFGGLVGLADPPASDAEQALAQARSAGIRVIMFTGDHVSTAAASARVMGILTDDTGVITNDELESLSPEELERLLDHFSVYVRLSAANKLRVVTALQNKGYVVAVTGDSAADAAVLRRADVGCAMGSSGTDVAKGAADVIVDDDRFSTIVRGIGMARSVYHGARKAVRYGLGCAMGLLLTLLGGLLIWRQFPLNAAQILWQNLVLMTLPALALGLERFAPGLMRLPPRTRDNFWEKETGLWMLAQGVLLGAAALTAFGLGQKADPSAAATMAFATLGFGSVLCAFSARFRDSLLLFRRHKFNYWLCAAALAAVGLLLVPLGASGLASVLGTAPLTAAQGWTVALTSAAPFVLLELLKLLALFRKKG